MTYQLRGQLLTGSPWDHAAKVLGCWTWGDMGVNRWTCLISVYSVYFLLSFFWSSVHALSWTCWQTGKVHDSHETWMTIRQYLASTPAAVARLRGWGNDQSESPGPSPELLYSE